MSSATAYLVVIGRVSDPAKMRAYNQALASSGLYARHGGQYLSLGRPAVELENWPDGVALVIASFPTRKAAEAFWWSDKYQNDLRPLREHAGVFQVAIFDAFSSEPGDGP